jgi:hypothetical protein
VGVKRKKFANQDWMVEVREARVLCWEKVRVVGVERMEGRASSEIERAVLWRWERIIISVDVRTVLNQWVGKFTVILGLWWEFVLHLL